MWRRRRRELFQRLHHPRFRPRARSSADVIQSHDLICHCVGGIFTGPGVKPTLRPSRGRGLSLCRVIFSQHIYSDVFLWRPRFQLRWTISPVCSLWNIRRWCIVRKKKKGKRIVIPCNLFILLLINMHKEQRGTGEEVENHCLIFPRRSETAARSHQLGPTGKKKHYISQVQWNARSFTQVGHDVASRTPCQGHTHTQLLARRINLNPTFVDLVLSK